jgi:hypothetical protein
MDELSAKDVLLWLELPLKLFYAIIGMLQCKNVQTSLKICYEEVDHGCSRLSESYASTLKNCY